MDLNWTTLLPLVFMAVMGLSLLAYVVLDGYDLGVGLLLPFATDEQKDMMVASIGPFWDANETWLVLGIGVLLIAFPLAHGIVLSALYLPVAVMLLGLILRGVSGVGIAGCAVMYISTRMYAASRKTYTAT